MKVYLIVKSYDYEGCIPPEEAFFLEEKATARCEELLKTRKTEYYEVIPLEVIE